MSEQVVQRMQALVDGFDARVQAAPSHAWNNPSPCEGWTAKDVVVHVANNYLRLGSALGGTELPQAGDDETTLDVWARAKDAIGVALASDLTQQIPGPMGPMAAVDMIGRFVASDTLVHTWDVARAVGGDEQLPADVVSAAFSGIKPLDAMLRRPGVFGDKVEPPEGADEQTQYLCFLGRQV